MKPAEISSITPPRPSYRPTRAEVEAYLPLVDRTTIEFRRRLPSTVATEEIRSAALFGLFDAFRKGGANAGGTFPSYARTRMRGAVVDALRACDSLSRGQRRQATADREAGRSSGLALIGVDDLGTDVVEKLVDGETPAADEILAATALGEGLKRAVESLPPRERVIVSLYYFEDVPLTDIAVELGVTLSRVSQLRARAVRMLRQALSANDSTDACVDADVRAA